jgi:hypothetical protein
VLRCADTGRSRGIAGNRAAGQEPRLQHCMVSSMAVLWLHTEMSSAVQDPWTISARDGKALGTKTCGRCHFWERYIGRTDGLCGCSTYAPQTTRQINKATPQGVITTSLPATYAIPEVLRAQFWPLVRNYDRCNEFRVRHGPPREVK